MNNTRETRIAILLDEIELLKERLNPFHSKIDAINFAEEMAEAT